MRSQNEQTYQYATYFYTMFRDNGKTVLKESLTRDFRSQFFFMNQCPPGEYLREFSKKFEMVLMGYSGARGTLIYEKNLKAKISYQTPFKYKGKYSNSYYYTV